MPDERPVPNVAPDVLNPIELRVAKLLTVGCSVDEIAARINADRETVESHCDAIYDKLGIHDPSTLARWATRFDVGRW
jgi:DNA-binding NarL/FixJ family response regulator